MASIGDIVGRLESAKHKVASAITSAESAVQQTEALTTQAQGMDLEDTATGLEGLRARIEGAGTEIIDVNDGFEKLIAAAEAIGLAQEPGNARTAVQLGEGVAGRDPGSNPETVAEKEVPPTPSAGMVPRWAAPDPGQSQLNTPWVSPDTWSPEKNAEVNPAARDEEAKIEKFPGWREKLTSKRGAALTALVVGGTSTAVSPLMDVPPAVQAAVTTFLTITAVWENHKANEEEKKKTDDGQ